MQGSEISTSPWVPLLSSSKVDSETCILCRLIIKSAQIQGVVSSPEFRLRTVNKVTKPPEDIAPLDLLRGEGSGSCERARGDGRGNECHGSRWVKWLSW